MQVCITNIMLYLHEGCTNTEVTTLLQQNQSSVTSNVFFCVQRQTLTNGIDDIARCIREEIDGMMIYYDMLTDIAPLKTMIQLLPLIDELNKMLGRKTKKADETVSIHIKVSTIIIIITIIERCGKLTFVFETKFSLPLIFRMRCFIVMKICWRRPFPRKKKTTSSPRFLLSRWRCAATWSSWSYPMFDSLRISSNSNVSSTFSFFFFLWIC